MERSEPVKPGKVFRIIDKTLDKITLALAVLAGVMTFFLTLMITYGVIVRYFLHGSVAATTEFAEYIIYIDVMLATPYVLKIDKHVRVDVFSRLLSPAKQKILNVVLNILGAIACLMTFYYSMMVVSDAFKSGINFVRVTPVKKWVIMAFVPLCMLLSAIIFIFRAYMFITRPDIQTDEDYQDIEIAKMNPKYNTSTSTDVVLPTYDDEEGGEEVLPDAAVGEVAAIEAAVEGAAEALEEEAAKKAGKEIEGGE